jgi:hypothetical protein
VAGLSDPKPVLASHVYYFEIGAGTWHGHFTFRVTSWRVLGRSRIGLRNGLLVVVMHVLQRCTGAVRLDSTIVPKPAEGACGVAENSVRLSRFGVPLYLLHERYVLDQDGTDVIVEAAERFGPVPHILSRTFTYPAEIRDGGMASTYHMPLLGAQWLATYQVGADRASLAGTLVCEWAKATEAAHRARVSG